MDVAGGDTEKIHANRFRTSTYTPRAGIFAQLYGISGLDGAITFGAVLNRGYSDIYGCFTHHSKGQQWAQSSFVQSPPLPFLG